MILLSVFVSQASAPDAATDGPVPAGTLNVVLPLRSNVAGMLKVGLPETPSPLVTVISFAVPVAVLPVKVSAAVCVNNPLVLYAANAVNVASNGCVVAVKAIVPEASGTVNVLVVPVVIPEHWNASSLVASPSSDIVRLLSCSWTVLDLRARVLASAIVGAPDTPSPFVMVVSLAVPVTDLVVQVLAAVLTAIPVVARPSKAFRSSARTSVGLPATPLPLVTVMPAAGAVRVLPVNVSAAVWVSSPLVL